MFAFTLTVALLGAADPELIRLAAPGLSAVQVEPSKVTFYSDHLAQQLSFQGLQVTTASQMIEVLGFERQRELTGCAEESESCAVELAGALGADGLLVGELAKVGGSYQANVRILSVTDGRVLAAWSARVRSEEALLEALTDGAVDLARAVSVKLGKPLAATASAERTEVPLTKVQRWAWAPAAAGVIAGAGGTLLLFQAKRRHDELIARTGEPLDEHRARVLRDEGWRYQTWGLVGAAAGLVGLGAGAAMYAFGGSTKHVQTSLALSPEGVSFGVSGVFP